MSGEIKIGRLLTALAKVNFAVAGRLMFTTALATEFAALHETRYEGHKPDILVGPIPIYTVQKEGHAASDELLKYRSMGTIFLAHQQGGKKTFTFTVKAFGPSRLLLMSYLKALLISGMHEYRSIDQLGLEPSSIEGINSEGKAISGKIEGAYNTVTEYIRASGDWKKETLAYHKTIPIITSSKIYLNMYLETLRYRESVDLGMNCMEIQCAFREYVPPTHARIVTYTALQKKKGKREYFDAYLSGSKLKAVEYMDTIVNVLWGSRKVLKELSFNPNLTQHQKNTYEMESSIIGAATALLVGYLA